VKAKQLPSSVSCKSSTDILCALDVTFVSHIQTDLAALKGPENPLAKSPQILSMMHNALGVGASKTTSSVCASAPAYMSYETTDTRFIQPAQ